MEPSESCEDVPPPRKKLKVNDSCSQRLQLTSLPYDVLVGIFKNLDLKTIGNCATLCSTFNNVAKDSSLYQKVTLKYNMNRDFLESFVSKIACPKELCIEYKYIDNNTGFDYSEFNKYVRIAMTKCGEFVKSLMLDNCRDDDILALLSEFVNLRELKLYRCKSSFETLASITSLSCLKCISCHFPPKIVSELVKNNESLERLFLADNTNVNVNEICENLSKCNDHVREIYFSERKRLRAKSLRTLGRLTSLESLTLVSGTGYVACDPEDSLEQIAAGCSKLEKLIIYGWKEINDENLIPILHMCTNLKELDLRGLNITVKSCREAALSLPFLKTLDVIKCNRVKKSQLAKLKEDFLDIDIPLE